jgi:hypothetical protein
VSLGIHICPRTHTPRIRVFVWGTFSTLYNHVYDNRNNPPGTPEGRAIASTIECDNHNCRERWLYRGESDSVDVADASDELAENGENGENQDDALGKERRLIGEGEEGSEDVENDATVFI